MKKLKTKEIFSNISPNYDYAAILSYIPKHVLFFDIETTGFSSSSSFVYCIGTAYFSDSNFSHSNSSHSNFNDSNLIIEQFFAQSAEDEPALFAAFANLAKRFDTLISYHGTGFDLPFFKGRQKRLGVDFSEIYTTKKEIDLYQLARTLRHLLPLSNLKQQTIEQFIGCKRTDSSTGGDLIPIYQQYLKHPDDALLSLIIQHNYDDLAGMASLLSLYAYHALLDGQFTVTGCSLKTYQQLDNSPGKELMMSCQLDIPLPAAFSCNNGLFYLNSTRTAVSLRVPVYEGTLKYFYSNPKDYYYLPNEDTALHKSVAAYVEKAHRKQATAATCYTKKTGIFLPQYEEVQMPALFAHYKDCVSYFELTDDFLNSPDVCKQYCIHMLHQLQTGKEPISHLS